MVNIGLMFPKTKGQTFCVAVQRSCYKVGCIDCNFVYYMYGQTDRVLEQG